MSQDLLDNPQTGQALEIVRESGLNDAERAAYDGFWDRVSIETTKKNRIVEVEAKLCAAEARANAAIEKLCQSARQMKADGMSVETITKYTGLSVTEIGKL